MDKKTSIAQILAPLMETTCELLKAWIGTGGAFVGIKLLLVLWNLVTITTPGENMIIESVGIAQPEFRFT